MRFASTVFLAVLLPAALLAQVETATSIRGLVKDFSGALVPGANVTIRNTGTNEERTTTTTDTSGFYAFPSLLPGTYNVVVTHPGFRRAEVAGRVAEVTEKRPGRRRAAAWRVQPVGDGLGGRRGTAHHRQHGNRE